jgi:hypothetical protein
MTSFIVAFKKLHLSLKGVQMKMPVDFYTLTFIDALNSAYPIWADRWRHASRDTTKPITLTMLYTDATDEARDRNPTAKETNVALYANNPRQSQRGGRGGGNSGGKSDKSSSQKEKCSHCSKPYHKEENCWKKHPEKEAEYKAKKQANREANKPSSSTTSSSTPSATALTTTSFQMYAGDIMVSTSFKNYWLVDTGADWHMTHDQSLFKTYTKSETLPEFTTAGKVVQPIGIGTVIIDAVHSKGHTVQLVLTNVYHLPSLPINLFSGTYIREYGVYVCGKTNTIRTFALD